MYNDRDVLRRNWTSPENTERAIHAKHNRTKANAATSMHFQYDLNRAVWGDMPLVFRHVNRYATHTNINTTKATAAISMSRPYTLKRDAPALPGRSACSSSAQSNDSEQVLKAMIQSAVKTTAERVRY